MDDDIASPNLGTMGKPWTFVLVQALNIRTLSVWPGLEIVFYFFSSFPSIISDLLYFLSHISYKVSTFLPAFLGYADLTKSLDTFPI